MEGEDFVAAEEVEGAMTTGPIAVDKTHRTLNLTGGYDLIGSSYTLRPIYYVRVTDVDTVLLQTLRANCPAEGGEGLGDVFRGQFWLWNRQRVWRKQKAKL